MKHRICTCFRASQGEFDAAVVVVHVVVVVDDDDDDDAWLLHIRGCLIIVFHFG